MSSTPKYIDVYLEDDKRVVQVPYANRYFVLVVPQYEKITSLTQGADCQLATTVNIKTKSYNLQKINITQYIGIRCDKENTTNGK